jgi:hypothetical protein
MALFGEHLRPKAVYPVYPPYHTGYYQEEYFYHRWNEDKKSCDRQYIDIFWTNIYCNGSHVGQRGPNIQQELINKLDPNGKYFTICQHDDGPFEQLPQDTIIFASGGNRKYGNIIALPSNCSKIPITYTELETRPLLASFVGSNTHPIRQKMFDICKNNEKIFIYLKGWSPVVNENEFNLFTKVTLNSVFTLAPRGYGKSSFRLYEAMQLGSIPVYISDDPYLPWNDELNWNEFCVLIPEKNIENLIDILMSYSAEQIEIMRNKMKQVWETHFSLEGMYQQIIRRLM